MREKFVLNGYHFSLLFRGQSRWILVCLPSIVKQRIWTRNIKSLVLWCVMMLAKLLLLKGPIYWFLGLSKCYTLLYLIDLSHLIYHLFEIQLSICMHENHYTVNKCLGKWLNTLCRKITTLVSINPQQTGWKE